MKTIAILVTLFAAAYGSYFHAPLAAPLVAPAALVATPWAAHVPQSRFTRTDWIQPGLTYTIPAVAKYHSVTPGFTSLHHTSVPVVGHAPVVAAPVVAAPAYAPAAPLLAHWRR